MVAVMDDEFKKGRKCSRSRAIGYHVRYFSEQPCKEALPAEVYKGRDYGIQRREYEEKEIMDEEEVEEMEVGLNVAEKTAVNNQETINQEIESSRLKVVDLDGLLKVEKKSSAELQFRMFVYVHSVLRPKLAMVGRPKRNLMSRACRCMYCKFVKYAEEYEASISQYEDRLDDNVKLSLKLEEAKRQVEDKTATILSRDSALNQLTSELVELKEKAASGSQHKAELDRLKADLRCLKERKAQSRADLAEIQAKNISLVDNLAHARRNVRRAVQHEKDTNERINQLCAQISESERQLRDGEIASSEGSREMKEFLRRKEELVENMRIDLTNSRQKPIDLTRQMSERIDQLTAELAESKAHRLKDNKRAAVTHQAFKDLVVHEQEKCDGEALHQ
ncbi:hypothetical protein GIB67_019126 [Kingdonia uniflora]|uniref:Uncharacterized protein n=1 Tax=Kingdonia uniflora TaxID=39325 RepID=A0A7J7MZU5_9MAGN|nr:hypothetical protein GIB67_019126 [Kingdonia uniflora]